MDIKWQDIEPDIAEEEFKEAKDKMYNNFKNTNNEDKDSNQENKDNTNNEDKDSNQETIGIASLFYETWNEIAVNKGYESIDENQKKFLDKHTQKFEYKYLKDIQIIPEIDFGLSHIVVYLPKWLKKHSANKTK